MGLVCHIGRLRPALILLLGLLSPPGQTADAQILGSSRFEPADDSTLTLDLADSGTRTHLERAKALLADEQWDDAVEILRQVMANHGGKLFEVADHRYIGLRDYCQLRLAALPGPALELYRQRVDSQARHLYEEGRKNLDRSRLEQVAREYFTSSYGDDALYALGELALAEANYPAARDAWQRLIETPQEPIAAEVFQRVRHAQGLTPEEAQLLDRWYRPIDTAGSPYKVNRTQSISDETVRQLVRLWNRHGVLPRRMAYPGTDLDLADVRARLVLASIMEGALSRARDELDAFSYLHPQAEGKLAGRTGKYGDLLAALLESSSQWPAVPTPQTWHTFAGNEQRNFVGAQRLDLGELVWSKSLERNAATDSRLAGSIGYTLRRVAEESDGLLSYHPIVVGNLVLVATADRILAFELDTGEPAWGSKDGAIFRLGDPAVRSHVRHSQLGAPRFTLTVYDSLLFARLGAPVTSSVVDVQFNAAPATLKWFDLNTQATQLQNVEAGDENRAFDGVPLCDGSNVYVAMRQGEVATKTNAHVACYDLQTGKLRWRRFVCAAGTAGRGQMDEITHNLLALEHGVLYFNTNLGAVAAISAADGEILWVSRYPRSMGGELNKTARHVYRDLNPCVLDKGRVFVAPADSERVFAFNAQTGEPLWLSAPGCPEDAVHLLGVQGDTLVASGDKLWAFDATTGRVLAVWPDNPLVAGGHGRGVLMGDEVVWPTRQELYRFRLQQRVARDSATGAERVVSWWEHTHIDNLLNRGAGGGNLVVAPNHLLIAASDKLYAFRRYRTEGKQSVVSGP